MVGRVSTLERWGDSVMQSCGCWAVCVGQAPVPLPDSGKVQRSATQRRMSALQGSRIHPFPKKQTDHPSSWQVVTTSSMAGVDRGRCTPRQHGTQRRGAKGVLSALPALRTLRAPFLAILDGIDWGSGTMKITIKTMKITIKPMKITLKKQPPK